MKRIVLLVVLLAACSTSAPVPQSGIQPPPPQRPGGPATVHVTAAALNVRREASPSSAVMTKVKRGDALTLLAERDGWSKVRLATGEEGWVSSLHVSSSRPRAKKPGCESESSFIKTPLASFSETGPHGLVVVEASVNTRGEVTATKVISNSTGDPALAVRAEGEISSATFKPPYRDCVPRSFIFTYKRSF